MELRTESAPTAIERSLVEAVMDAIGRPPLDARLWDGRTAWRSEAIPVATLHFDDRSTLWRFLLRPESGFADGYVEGRLRVEGDLPSLLASMLRPPAPSWRPKLPRSLRMAGSRKADHRWLDEGMVDGLDGICRKLDLEPEQRVIVVGSGCAALALHAAERCGVYVQAFDVAGEQLRWARARARERDIEHRVEFIADDHRSARGECDAFVVLGMLEQTGGSRSRELGEIIDRCLAPAGRGLLHFVVRARPEPANAWFAREMVPDAAIPALGEVLELLEPFGLAVLELENLRRHHARTLEHRLEQFEAATRDEVHASFGERQVRRQRLSLASAIAAVRVGTRQLYQVVFARAHAAARPRQHLYPAEIESCI